MRKMIRTYSGDGIENEVVGQIEPSPDGRKLQVKGEVLVNLVVNRWDEVWHRDLGRKNLERPVKEQTNDS